MDKDVKKISKSIVKLCVGSNYVRNKIEFLLEIAVNNYKGIFESGQFDCLQLYISNKDLYSNSALKILGSKVT